MKTVGLTNAIKARQRDVKRLGAAMTVGVLNQFVTSGTNFATVLYLVRSLGKGDFGLYSFGFGLALLISGLISAGIAVQLVVNLPDQPERYRTSYALGHAGAVILLGLVVVGLGAAAPALTSYHEFAVLALPVASAAALFSFRDLLMRVAYAERREIVVLISSAAMACGVTVAYFVLYCLERQLSASDGLLVYAFGQLAGCSAALLLLRLPWRRLHLVDICKAFRDAWVGGRWNILTNMVYNVRSHTHNFVVGPLLGVAALGEVNAARVLVTPAIMAIPPLSQILMPRLADRRANGQVSLAHAAVWTTGGLTSVALAYIVPLIASLPWLLPLALGDTYKNLSMVVIAWCVVSLLMTMRNGLTMVLEVARAFRALLVANIAPAVLAVSLALILTPVWGAIGAIVALAAAEAALTITLVVLLYVKTTRPKQLTFADSEVVIPDKGKVQA